MITYITSHVGDFKAPPGVALVGYEDGCLTAADQGKLQKYINLWLLFWSIYDL